MRERYVQQRLIPMAMEPRGVCAVPGPMGDDFTVYSSTQIPHILKVQLAIVTGIAEHSLSASWRPPSAAASARS